MSLDIIHRPVYISKHNVSETGFCLQVKPTTLGQIDRPSVSAKTPKRAINHMRAGHSSLKASLSTFNIASTADANVVTGCKRRNVISGIVNCMTTKG
jgi:hypothetical protein